MQYKVNGQISEEINDDGSYTIFSGDSNETLVKQAPAYDTNKYVFEGWVYNGNLYQPNDVFKFNEQTIAGADEDGVITFEAQLKKIEGSEYVPYTVKYFFQKEDGDYEQLDKYQDKNGFGIKGSKLFWYEALSVNEDGYTLDEYTSNITLQLQEQNNIAMIYFDLDKNGNKIPDDQETKVTLTFTSEYGFEGEEGNEVKLENQLPGTKFTAPTPVDTDSDNVVFTGWDPTLPEKNIVPADSATYKAVYEDDENNNGTPDDQETKYSIHYVSGTEDPVSGMPNNVTGILKSTEQIVSTVVPVRSGYIFTGWTTKDVTVAEGRFIMPANDVTFTATWTLDEDGNGTPDDQEALVTFTVVNGTFEDGSTSRSMKINLDTVLTEADVPTVVASNGYTGGSWNTTINGFVIKENVVFTYTFDRINVPVDPTNPGDGTDEPIAPTTPTTPVARASEDPITTDDTQTEEVEENTTPKTDGKEVIEDVENEITPKGNNSKWSLINLVCTIIGVLLAIVLLVSRKYKGILKAVTTLFAVGLVVIFFMTQDMSLPMALTDKWTIWMVVIAIVELVLVLVGRHWKDVDDEDQEQQA